MSKWSKGGKRVCEAAAACLAVMATANVAEANTTVTVPSTGWSRTYANGSWAHADSALGSFGAGVSYSTALSTDAQGAARSADSRADLDVQMFDQSFTLVGVEGKLSTTSTSPTSPTEYLGATVGGFTLLSQVLTPTQSDSLSLGVNLGEVKAGGVELGLNVVGSYSFTGFSVCLEASATKDAWIGPIPITITGALDGCPYMSVQAASASPSNGKPQLAYDMKPGVDTSFTLSAGFGSSEVASAGLWGSVDLINFGTDVASTMSFDPATTNLDYRLVGKETLSSLSGSAGVYASVGYKALSVTYQHTFFAWDGITWKDQIVLADSVPAASEVRVDIGFRGATGNYLYDDSEGAAESGTSYQWYQAWYPNGAYAFPIDGATGSSYTYSTGDTGAYLQFCATPRNSAGNWGAQACSDWTPVGRLVMLYHDTNYSGAKKAFAYERAGQSSQCVDIVQDFNDVVSSYIFSAPISSPATLYFFKGGNCTGSRMSITASPGTEQSATNMPSGWSDVISSFLVVHDETVAATDVRVDIGSNVATARYTFADSAGVPEYGSTFQWYRASDRNGTNAAPVAGITGAVYPLNPQDEGKFLRVCVVPSTAYLGGYPACSDWSAGVGDMLRIYQDSNYGGASYAYAYKHAPSGTCTNLTDYGFNDKMSSYELTESWRNSPGTTAVFYHDGNCTGWTISATIPTGSTGYSQPAVQSSFNDDASSVRIYWNPSASVSTPSVSLSGNKASAVYTWSDGLGGPDRSLFDWYVADDASGTNAASISNVHGPSYALTGIENSRFLQVCVNPSNGVSSGDRRCSAWFAVGYEIQLFSEPSLTAGSGTALAFAYASTPSGTCFNLADYGFDDVTQAFQAFSSSTSNAKVFVYQGPNCVKDTTAGLYSAAWQTNQQGYYAPPGGTVHSPTGKVYSTDLGTRYDSTISSFKVEY
jgi:hypothetical protein